MGEGLVAGAGTGRAASGLIRCRAAGILDNADELAARFEQIEPDFRDAIAHGFQIQSVSGRHLSLIVPGGFEVFFEEVAAIAIPDADPRQETRRIAAIAARYGVEFLGRPPTPRPEAPCRL